MDQINRERRDNLNRLINSSADGQDRMRLLEVLGSDVKVTKGKQTKKELLLVLSLQYGRFTPPDDSTSLKFVRACLNKKKLLLRKTEIMYIDKVEKYASLTIENLYAWGLQLLQNPLNVYLTCWK